LIDGMVRLMDTPADFVGPVNMGNPTEFSMLQLAEMVVKLVGSNSKITFIPLPSDDPKQRKPDISLAETVMTWRPRVPLEDGLRETITYFRGHLGV
jgi:UDP-glucuronate decarboxylase